MKRKPHLYKLTFRASAEVRTWLDIQARDLMKTLGISTLTEARGLVLTAMAGANGAFVRETFREELSKTAPQPRWPEGRP